MINNNPNPNYQIGKRANINDDSSSSSDSDSGKDFSLFINTFVIESDEDDKVAKTNNSSMP